MDEEGIRRMFYGYNHGDLTDDYPEDHLVGRHVPHLDYSRYTTDLNNPEDYNVFITIPEQTQEQLDYIFKGLDGINLDDD